MKLLKIESNEGQFRDANGNYKPIDKINKEELLQLVTWTLNENDIEFDTYDENAIKNQAHQVVYKSVVQKLHDLRGRKQEFIDDSKRLFLKEYEKYSGA